GLKVSAGRTAFEYVTEDAPATGLDTIKNSWSAIGYLSKITARGSLYGAGIKYARFYEGKDEVSVCTPIGAGPSLSCSNKVIGAPEKDSSKSLFLEFRRRLNSQGLALSPVAEYEIDESEWTFKLPVYIAVDDAEKLRAGIQFGWGSKEDEFEAMLFFTRDFSLTSFWP
ncbi:MAG TPA: hypothetical protein VK629_20450, partial [Steroidobacteraceae bacterium]|nr:hypothetical protein [Steroidobacteraceae bacterium]